MSFRFLHTSDLHLGRAFGTFPESIRYRLREARHGAIARLAQAARSGGVSTILLAGDTFDAETPAPETLRQALRAMAAEGDMVWVVIPGNHDSLGATELWRRIASEASPNLRLALEPVPIALAPGVTLLPAPCTRRRPGRDLTDWMAEAPGDGLRIGLAHGAVTSFDGEEGAPGIIPPGRAATARLDWLALGDWHGTLSISDRVWYSGSPEPDGFKHDAPGGALLVALDGPGALPQVARVETGCFRWRATDLSLLPAEDAAARLAAALPALRERRDTLMRVTLGGRLPLPSRAALLAAAEEAAPDFGWFDCDASRLAIEARPDDLDLIDRAGALRTAAESLLAEAANPALPAEDRAAAEGALGHLFRLAQEVQV